MKKIIIITSILLSIAIYTNENDSTIKLPFPSNTKVEEKEEVEIIDAKGTDQEESTEENSEEVVEEGNSKEGSEEDLKDNSNAEITEVEVEKASEEKIENKDLDTNSLEEKTTEVTDEKESEESESEISKEEEPKKSTLPNMHSKEKKLVKKVPLKKRKIKNKPELKKTVKKENSKTPIDNIISDNNKTLENELIPKSKDSLETEKEVEPSIVSDTKNNLPNLKKKNKKDKESDEVALGMGPYVRGNYQLNRNNEKNATYDYNISTSGEGNTSSKSKLELIRLLAKDRKIQQAKNLIESLQDVDLKYKGFFELAAGLDNSAKNKKEKEESLDTYLYIITEAPREDAKNPEEPNPILPKASFAAALLLYKMESFLPALDHLSNIILKYKNSEFLDEAIYLSGKIYEEGTSGKIRNLERAKKYYKMFLDKKSEKFFKDSIYLKEVEKRFLNLNSTKF